MTFKKTLTSVLLSALFIAPAFAASHAASDAINAAVASPERPESERNRDAKRKPADVLDFIGIDSGGRVADLMGGGGYYTDLLSRTVGDEGSVIAFINYYVRGRFMGTFGKDGVWEKRLSSEQWSKNVTPLVDDFENFKSDTPLDAAIMVMFYHDTAWQGTERDKMNTAIFDALKPGGVYAVIDHSAEIGSGIRDVKTLHRIDRDFVVKEITAAGFELVGESDLLSNPADTRDYHVFRDFQTNRDSTDRFLLKFRKPE